jgi:hypothetical protein
VEFFEALPAPIDHVVVTAGGPYYERLAEMDFRGRARSARRPALRAPVKSHRLPADVERRMTFATASA